MVCQCGGRVRLETVEGKQMKEGRKDVQVSRRTGDDAKGLRRVQKSGSQDDTNE